VFAVHDATSSLLLRYPDPFHIRELIYHSRVLDHPDYNVVVKHTLDNVRVLRNLGLDAPVPEYRFRGKFQPYNHQRVMMDFRVTHKRGFDLSEMGAMKTAPSCWAADMLMEHGIIKKAAVFAPKSILELIWAQEIFDQLPHRTCNVITGSAQQRAKRMAEDVDFYLINHDGITVSAVYDSLASRNDINLYVVDEGTAFSNENTDKYKLLAGLLQKHKDNWLWWATGSPTPHYPTDAWAQIRLVNPARVPPYKGRFRAATMTKVNDFKWVSKPNAKELVYEAMQPAVRFKKSDCIDLPPMGPPINMLAQLTDEQKKYYAKIKNEMQATIGGRPITAVNAGDAINKLRQVLLGCIKDPGSDNYLDVDHKPRFKVLVEAIESAEAKAIVVVPFKGIMYTLGRDIDELNRHGDRKANPLTYAIVNGDVTSKRRVGIFKDFKTTSNPHVLLCHSEVMAHGLNLTEADVVIFYGPIYSNDQYMQVIERINRSGQTRKMSQIRIGCHPLDWAIYKTLDARTTEQNALLDLYQTAITG
jgi:hypothetical protein